MIARSKHAAFARVARSGRSPAAVLTAALVALLIPGCRSAPVRGAERSGEGGPKASVVSRSAAILSAVGAGGAPRIRPGETMAGRLEATDRLLDDGTRADVWIYSGTNRERIQVTMTSSEFRPVIVLATVDGTSLRPLAGASGGDGQTAELFIELPGDGRYAILANAETRDGLGSYAITLGSRGVAAAVDWGRTYLGGGDRSDRYALLVGISDYPGTAADLQGAPLEDVRAMRDVLVKKYGFDPRNIVTVTDQDATRDHIINAFQRHLGQAGPSGVAVFYYSGHGTQLPNNVGSLAPLDPEPDDKDEALWVWGYGARASLIVDDELGVLADRLGTGRVLLILDSCNAGTGTRGATGLPKRVRFADVERDTEWPRELLGGREVGSAPAAAPSEGMGEALTQPQRHVLLAASASNQLSWVALDLRPDGTAASVFTHFLAGAIESAGADVTFADLVRGVRAGTERFTQSQFGRRQTPQVEGTQASASVASFLGRPAAGVREVHKE